MFKKLTAETQRKKKIYIFLAKPQRKNKINAKCKM